MECGVGNIEGLGKEDVGFWGRIVGDVGVVWVGCMGGEDIGGDFGMG